MQFLKDYLLFSLSMVLSLSVLGQISYYSDCFQGGVVGDGYNAWYTGGISQVNLPMPAGSTVRKAFLFSNIYKWQGNLIPAQDKIIEINGLPLTLSEQHTVGNSINMQSNQTVVSTTVLDITNFIDPSISSYVINPFINESPVVTPLYSDFYILVLYENNLLINTCLDVYLNNSNTTPQLSYALNVQNPVNLLNEIGLTLHSSSICDNSIDRYDVFVNGTSIGSIGGQEDNTTVYCAGVTGSFYFENGQLFGIGNDVPNATMNGLDAIANIQPYLTDENVHVRFEYTSNFSPYSNLINQLFLAYTTPCDTFSMSVPNDTTVCAGTQLQLNVTGGQSYEWLATNAPSGAPGLSCTDCPNPIFTADSSMHYAVRIWNNDSCSVVRPIHILVNDLQIDSTLLSSPDCGASNGDIEVFHNAFVWQETELYLDGVLQVSDTLASNLADGTYTLHLQDEMGCVGPTITINLPAVNTTIAQFGLDPLYGNAPLEVNVYQLSHNATNYEWYVNGDFVGNSLSNYTLPNGGEYTFELVAWQYDPACADTFSMGVFVTEIVIPTAFTPDNDGVNDFWEIQGFTEYLPKATVKIYDRWGSLIYEVNDGKYPQYPWDGTVAGEELPVGSYFYLIEPNNFEQEEMKGTVSVLR
jgi:gliding motility-associated-like protein